MQEGAGAWGAAGPHLNCSLRLPSPSSSATATTTATKATCGQQMFKNKSSRCSMLQLLVALVAVSIVVVAVVVFLRFGIEFNDQKWKAAKNICVAQSVNAMAKLNPPRQPCVWGRRRWRRRGHWYGAAVADTASCITICSWRRCRRCSLTRQCQRIAQCDLHLPLLLTLQPDTHSSEEWIISFSMQCRNLLAVTEAIPFLWVQRNNSQFNSMISKK